MRPALASAVSLALAAAWLGPARGDSDAGASAATTRGLPTGETHEIAYAPAPALPIRGPRFAKVTLDLWIGFGQPRTAAAAALARRAFEREAGGDTRVVPHLTAVGPPGAELAAEAALEAADEGRFWPFCERVLGDRLLSLTAAELTRAGREAGLDGARLAEALATHRHRAALAELDREARALGHPHGELAVNGVLIAPYDRDHRSADDALDLEIDSARRRAQTLLDEGVPLSRVYDRVTSTATATSNPPWPSGEPRRRVTLDLSSAPSRGSLLAPVTIVVYGNVACARCAQAAELIARLGRAHPGRVREVWKGYYGDFARYGIEPAAVELEAAARAQGRFWELHDRAIASGLSLSRSGPVELERLAREAGLDITRARRELGERGLRALVEGELREGRLLGVGDAPGLVVNGLVLRQTSSQSPWTAWSYERLERLFEDELARGVLDRLQSR